MECEHKRKRKLFWMNTKPNKWIKTRHYLCLDCDCIITSELKENENKCVN